jgi:transposase-like protein
MSSKRRTFTAQFKLETVIEGLRGEKSVAQICRERHINDNLYYKWRDTFLERASHLFEERSSSQYDQQAARIAELERLVGKQALELEILKKAGSLLDAQRRRNGS